MHKTWLAVVAVVIFGCRTEIRPTIRQELPVQTRAPSGECAVHFFATALDVPQTAKGLGWVKVARAEGEDETFAKLREAVCAMGGNGYSQAHWLRPSDVSVADPPTELEANAWFVPNPADVE